MTDPRQPRVLFIGGGNMATAMIGGLLGDASSDAEVLVIEPNAESRARLEQQFRLTTFTGPEPTIRADAIVLAVKPQVAVTALQQARPLLAANGDAILISIAAGTTLSTLAEASGGHRARARAMPNTPALIGEGVTGLYVAPTAGPEQAELAERVVASTGAVVRLDDEAALDAVTSVSGSGPAYVFYLIEAMMKGALAGGLSEEQARVLVQGTVRGAALLAERSEEPASVLRQRVTSPNGTTAAAIEEFDRRGVMDGIVAGVAAARARSEELGRG